MIAIVDYDMGNVSSVANMLKRAGCTDIQITRDPKSLRAASKLILPGVGAFDKGMRNIRDFGLRGVLDEAVLDRRVPILGICLGMQLMTAASEEGTETGLGWIAGNTVRFRFSDESTLKVPHMGWNYIRRTRASPLLSEQSSRFYFVHAYYVQCEREADVAATAKYGFDFTCAVARENVFGVQFHPEKSHRFGLNLLERFVGL